jgi:hypothetical protein
VNVERTFREAADDAPGTVYHDVHEDGIRFAILRGPASINAYVGVPKSHPLAGHSYDDVRVNCHGGLTYAGNGLKGLSDEWYWYGWDYGHAGDRSFYDLKYPLGELRADEKEWGVKDILADTWDALYDFKAQVRLAESIERQLRIRNAGVPA